MRADRVRLGIDFGTSSTVAVLGQPDGQVRPLLFGETPILPSAVCVDWRAPDPAFLIGRDAIHAGRAHPDSFEPNPKLRIDDGSVLLGTAELPVTELIGAVLRRVGTEAERVAGAPVGEVTLTYPASWGPRRRSVLQEAARIAGLAEPALVAEPVAAAAYFVDTLAQTVPVGRCVVVYDFGAGTFDASVVGRTDDGFTVLAEEGLRDAGGLDIDNAVVAYFGATYGGWRSGVAGRGWRFGVAGCGWRFGVAGCGCGSGPVCRRPVRRRSRECRARRRRSRERGAGQHHPGERGSGQCGARQRGPRERAPRGRCAGRCRAGAGEQRVAGAGAAVHRAARGTRRRRADTRVRGTGSRRRRPWAGDRGGGHGAAAAPGHAAGQRAVRGRLRKRVGAGLRLRRARRAGRPRRVAGRPLGTRATGARRRRRVRAVGPAPGHRGHRPGFAVLRLDRRILADAPGAVGATRRAARRGVAGRPGGAARPHRATAAAARARRRRVLDAARRAAVAEHRPLRGHRVGPGVPDRSRGRPRHAADLRGGRRQAVGGLDRRRVDRRRAGVAARRRPRRPRPGPGDPVGGAGAAAPGGGRPAAGAAARRPRRRPAAGLAKGPATAALVAAGLAAAGFALILWDQLERWSYQAAPNINASVFSVAAGTVVLIGGALLLVARRSAGAAAYFVGASAGPVSVLAGPTAEALSWTNGVGLVLLGAATLVLAAVLIRSVPTRLSWPHPAVAAACLLLIMWTTSAVPYNRLDRGEQWLMLLVFVAIPATVVWKGGMVTAGALLGVAAGTLGDQFITVYRTIDDTPGILLGLAVLATLTTGLLLARSAPDRTG